MLGSINTWVAKLGEVVVRLQEYRTALITAAMTEKNDVQSPR